MKIILYILLFIFLVLVNLTGFVIRKQARNNEKQRLRSMLSLVVQVGLDFFVLLLLLFLPKL